MAFDPNNVYGSGLDQTEWNLLRDTLLDVAHNQEIHTQSYANLPKELRNHVIGRIIGAYLDTDSSANLDEAASLMVGGMENPWLALSRS